MGVLDSKRQLTACLAMRVLTFVILKSAISKQNYFSEFENTILRGRKRIFKIQFSTNTPIKLEQRTQINISHFFSPSYLHLCFTFHFVFALLLLSPQPAKSSISQSTHIHLLSFLQDSNRKYHGQQKDGSLINEDSCQCYWRISAEVGLRVK